jgi:hypothetical protein
VADDGDSGEIGSELSNIRDELVSFERTFEERIPRIAGIYNM